MGSRGYPVRPFISATVNAGCDCWVEMQFVDRTSSPQTPSTLTYRLDNLSACTSVIGVTSLSPSGSSYELDIPASANQMADPWRPSQIMQVTVVATFSDGSTDTQIVCYELCALQTPS